MEAARYRDREQEEAELREEAQREADADRAEKIAEAEREAAYEKAFDDESRRRSALDDEFEAFVAEQSRLTAEKAEK